MPIPAPPHVQNLLHRLHERSLEQERVLAEEGMGEADFDTYMKDKFIALEQDKCEFVYTLARATGARTIVEAGTSFGVSTIYLALAVSANTASGGAARVIATENEPSKATIARQNWQEAGEEVASVIELREGDLRETLKLDLPAVDMLLLDIWAPLAFPTLQVVLPKLRPGAVVITDNTIGSAARYKDLLDFLRDPKNRFINQTLPYHNGLEMSVYSP